jgi:hypothetical protein
VTRPRREIATAGIEASIEQLRKYLGTDEAAPLIAVLEAMRRNPQDTALVDQLVAAFDGLGMLQGAVLTYAPYVAVVLSDYPFDDSPLKRVEGRSLMR